MKGTSNFMTLEIDFADQVAMTGQVKSLQDLLKQHPTLMYISVHNCSNHLTGITRVFAVNYSNFQVLCSQAEMSVQ